MEISASMVKELREQTGVGMMRCKKALTEAGGDVAEAEKLLRKAGVAAAAKRADRATGEGQVASYIHTGGKIGVLVEVNEGIGKVNTTNLTKDGDTYTNDAYGESDVTLQISIEAGVGKINLDVE